MSEAIMPDVVEPTPERAERAYQLDQAVHECAKDITSNFYKLALLLSCIKEEKLYRELGYETFQAYLASVDVAFSLSHIQMGLRLVRNVIANEELRQRLEPKLGFPLEGLPPSKLDAVLPAVKSSLPKTRTRKPSSFSPRRRKSPTGACPAQICASSCNRRDSNPPSPNATCASHTRKQLPSWRQIPRRTCWHSTTSSWKTRTSSKEQQKSKTHKRLHSRCSHND
jgi:hypothetical protein